MKTKKLPNNTAVLRSEVDTQEKLDALVEVAKYQGFDISRQSNCRLVAYILDYIHVDKTCGCLMQTDNFKTINIITLAEFLSYGEPKSWHERGELPPVGEVCDVFSGNLEVSTNFKIDYVGKSIIAGTDRDNEEVVFRFANCNYKFKPLQPKKTERELAVEELAQHLKVNAALTFEGISEELINFGYHNGKKVKPLPEEYSANQVYSRSFLIENNYCIAEGE